MPPVAPQDELPSLTLPRPPTIGLFAPLSRRTFCSPRRSSRQRRRPHPRSFPGRSPPPPWPHLCLVRGRPDFLKGYLSANLNIGWRQMLSTCNPPLQVEIDADILSLSGQTSLLRGGQPRHAGAPPVARPQSPLPSLAPSLSSLPVARDSGGGGGSGAAAASERVAKGAPRRGERERRDRGRHGTLRDKDPGKKS